MLFRKKLPRSCRYCMHGTKLNENEILCTRKGVVNIDRSCLGFSYDPCKRIPQKMKAPSFSEYDKKDFSL